MNKQTFFRTAVGGTTFFNLKAKVRGRDSPIPVEVKFTA